MKEKIIGILNSENVQLKGFECDETDWRNAQADQILFLIKKDLIEKIGEVNYEELAENDMNHQKDELAIKGCREDIIQIINEL